MKKDYDSLHLASITVRLPISMLQELDSKSGSKQKYRDRSAALRSLVTLGLRVESLLEIQNDPEKKQEFEEKFASLLKEKNVEQSLEAMDETQLNSIIFIANNLKEKKVQLLLDSIKSS